MDVRDQGPGAWSARSTRASATGGAMIHPERIARVIASIVRDEMIAGRYPGGEALPMQRLADRFGVSTTPVREALAILERQGLVQSRTNRSFVVRAVTPEEILDTYRVHAFVSGELTGRACNRLSGSDLDALAQLDVTMRSAVDRGDIGVAGDLNHEFHRAIHLAGDSDWLVRFLRESTPFVVRRADPDLPGWREQLTRGHSGLLELLRTRDDAAAKAWAVEHLMQSGRQVVAHRGLDAGTEVP